MTCGGTPALDCVMLFCPADSPLAVTPKKLLQNNFNEAAISSSIFNNYVFDMETCALEDAPPVEKC